MKLFLLIAPWCLIQLSTHAQDFLWKTQTGRIQFRSDAPLEIIEAEADGLLGLIDPEARTFAFVIEIDKFEGFNSPLQRLHFNENYLESDRYPKATFKGRIIEKVDLTEDGTYIVRAKGLLNIHGVEQERIIKSEVSVKDEELKIQAFFSVRLDDHRITIPRIVQQKIAQNIQVRVNGIFQQVRKP
ncbi:MAG: YceI family protein [Bacteroidetes bacterium]|nr:MAG: YceI family protein [Bacteroidota bacterium]